MAAMMRFLQSSLMFRSVLEQQPAFGPMQSQQSRQVQTGTLHALLAAHDDVPEFFARAYGVPNASEQRRIVAHRDCIIRDTWLACAFDGPLEAYSHNSRTDTGPSMRMHSLHRFLDDPQLYRSSGHF
jgi:hypothetical protein